MGDTCMYRRLICFDLDGQELWKRTDLGKWEHAYGNAASPVLHGELVLQWCGPNDSQGRNFLLAVSSRATTCTSSKRTEFLIATNLRREKSCGRWSNALAAGRIGGRWSMP